MTNDELNIRCAERLGWKSVPDEYYVDRIAWIKPNCPSRFATIDIPDYSTDPSEAIQLCDRMREEGWECFIDNSMGEWRCAFLNVALDAHYWMEDPSLARAIAIAFIAAKGEGK